MFIFQFLLNHFVGPIGSSGAQNQYLAFCAALAISICTVWRRNRLGLPVIGRAFFNSTTISMAFTVLSIMAFKSILVESHIIDQVRMEFAALHFPITAIIAFLPFLAGLLTGIAVGFVGASFPLVITLLPPGETPFAYATLAYSFGIMGMMLSPVHLCLLMTNEYFHASLPEVYKYLWWPTITILIFTIFLFVIYSRLLPV